jgi:hypothetical protein
MHLAGRKLLTTKQLRMGTAHGQQAPLGRTARGTTNPRPAATAVRALSQQGTKSHALVRYVTAWAFGVHNALDQSARPTTVLTSIPWASQLQRGHNVVQAVVML